MPTAGTPPNAAKTRWNSKSTDKNMNTKIITETARKTLEGKLSFPEVVSQLLAAEVEYYHVDYVAMGASQLLGRYFKAGGVKGGDERDLRGS